MAERSRIQQLPPSLVNRIAAAAAQEGQRDPWQWASSNAWTLAASPGWAEAWGSATTNVSDEVNPDTGARSSVITDGMILGAVQAIRQPVVEPSEPA